MQPLWPRGRLLPAENATLALNHLTHSCCAGLWEGFPHNIKPVPSWWECSCAESPPPSPTPTPTPTPSLGRSGNMHRCLCVNSAHVEKDPRCNIGIHESPQQSEAPRRTAPVRWAAPDADATRVRGRGHDSRQRTPPPPKKTSTDK